MTCRTSHHRTYETYRSYGMAFRARTMDSLLSLVASRSVATAWVQVLAPASKVLTLKLKK